MWYMLVVLYVPTMVICALVNTPFIHTNLTKSNQKIESKMNLFSVVINTFLSFLSCWKFYHLAHWCCNNTISNTWYDYIWHFNPLHGIFHGFNWNVLMLSFHSRVHHPTSVVFFNPQFFFCTQRVTAVSIVSHLFIYTFSHLYKWLNLPPVG